MKKYRIHALRAAVAIVLLSSFAIAQDNDHPDRQYLALGDSFTFAYITQAGFEYVNPQNFVGFPDYVGLRKRLDVVNAACPGETAGSFLSATAPDNGCRSFRAAAPLHVRYTSTQLEFAKSFLLTHRDTKLVTVSLGANDVKLLQQACLGDLTCIRAGLQPVLGQLVYDILTILGDLRATGYRGPIVVLNYYSTDYTDLNLTGVIAALNQALALAAGQGGALVADLFTTFKAAALPAGGRTCVAGLLNASPHNQFLCDDHPSQSGHLLAAKTIAQTLGQTEDNER